MKLYILSLILISLVSHQICLTEATKQSQNSSTKIIQIDTLIVSLKDSLIKNEFKFIIHGIVQNHSKSVENFKNKYGVSFKFETCVIDPISYQKAITNNKSIAKILNEKYGNTWIHELPISPLGVK